MHDNVVSNVLSFIAEKVRNGISLHGNSKNARTISNNEHSLLKRSLLFLQL